MFTRHWTLKQKTLIGNFEIDVLLQWTRRTSNYRNLKTNNYYHLCCAIPERLFRHRRSCRVLEIAGEPMTVTFRRRGARRTARRSKT